VPEFEKKYQICTEAYSPGGKHYSPLRRQPLYDTFEEAEKALIAVGIKGFVYTILPVYK
jgi:hypothetical protein